MWIEFSIQINKLSGPGRLKLISNFTKKGPQSLSSYFPLIVYIKGFVSSHVYLRSMGKLKKNSKDMQPANIKVQKDRIMCKSIGNQTDDWLILRSFWLSSSRTCLFFVLNSIQSSWAAKKKLRSASTTSYDWAVPSNSL